MRCTVVTLALASIAYAQPTVAPTPILAGDPRGENVSGYNITNSFESGYRFRTLHGNQGKYRSDVNFGNGLRLLSASFTVHSREGQGGWIDELLLNTQGLGNDPYQLASFRVQKNRLYRYDLLWRENAYFNPALTIAAGRHLLDTSRALQDHSFVLFPQGGVRLLAGYSRNSQSGPALTTFNFPDTGGAEYLFQGNVRRRQHEYRIGAELTFAGTRLHVTRGWERFREDTAEAREDPATPGLSSALREQPLRGSVSHWRVHLLHDRGRWFGVNGRFAYAGGRQDFTFDESLRGAEFGQPFVRQTVVTGNARRPVTAANLTLTLFPAARLTLTNHSSFHQTRMDGDADYREFDNATQSFALVHFQFLRIRAFTNTATLNFTVTPRIAVYGGYHAAARSIKSIQQVAFFGNQETVRAVQSNTLHSGLSGLRVRPWKPLTLNFEAEIGRANRPFYPVSDKDYHALGARAQYRSRTLTVSGSMRTLYNFNSVSLLSHSSRSRSAFADLSWSPRTWFGVDLSYSRLHLDSLTGIAYFANGSLLDDRSFYVSNIHSGTAGLRFTVRSRVDLFAGYSRVEDTGGSLKPAALSNFTAFQSYPLAFDSPLARVSVRLNTRFRWNAGYQFYRYRDTPLPFQNYRAHTGYTSLTVSF